MLRALPRLPHLLHLLSADATGNAVLAYCYLSAVFPVAVSIGRTSISRVNRSLLTDSNKSLDVRAGCNHAGGMTKTYHVNLHLTRSDPARNIARYYQLTLEPTLLGPVAVVKRWGRQGTTGRSKFVLCDTENMALATLLAILRTKRAKGYVPSPR